MQGLGAWAAFAKCCGLPGEGSGPWGWDVTPECEDWLGILFTLDRGPVELFIKMKNVGAEPILYPSIVSVFYHTPTLSIHLEPGDPNWELGGVAEVPFPAQPGDTVLAGPIIFDLPPLNEFGQPHWTFGARVEDENPPGSGWLMEDMQVAANNVWTDSASIGELRQFYFLIENPLNDTAKVVLRMDTREFPETWFAELTPLPSETLLLMANEERVCTLSLEATEPISPFGKVLLMEDLYLKWYTPCESCGDSLCGGRSRMTGGATVVLLVPSPAFVRGEGSADGLVEYTDLLVIAGYLFLGAPPPICLDAADANDDGLVSYTDMLYLANYIFSSGPEPPQPFPDCGTDPTFDQLGCESFPPCE